MHVDLYINGGNRRAGEVKLPNWLLQIVINRKAHREANLGESLYP